MSRTPMLAAQTVDVAKVLLNGAILLLIAAAIAAAVLWTRGMLLRRHGPGAHFSMERLGELHRSGQLSDEEYSRLRRRVLGLDAEAGKEDTGVPGAEVSPLRDADENDDGERGAPPGGGGADKEPE